MRITYRVRLLNFIRNFFKLPPLEFVLVKLTQNKRPNDLVCKFVPNPYQFPKPTWRHFKNDRFKMLVDISDYLGHYYYFGFCDLSVERLFSLCNKNSIVLDIGSNIGYTALQFASLANEGQVVGFEPDPYNFQICAKNFGLNNFENLKLLNIALGNEEGQVHMEVPTQSNRGGNRVTKGSVPAGTVPITKLDTIFPTLHIPRVDLIKIDVEGYELYILQGGLNTLNEFSPTLFIELDDNNLREQGTTARGLINFLKDAGYKSIKNAITNEVIDGNEDFTNSHFDIIAKKGG